MGKAKKRAEELWYRNSDYQCLELVEWRKAVRRVLSLGGEPYHVIQELHRQGQDLGLEQIASYSASCPFLNGVLLQAKEEWEVLSAVVEVADDWLARALQALNTVPHFVHLPGVFGVRRACIPMNQKAYTIYCTALLRSPRKRRQTTLRPMHGHSLSC